MVLMISICRLILELIYILDNLSYDVTGGTWNYNKSGNYAYLRIGYTKLAQTL